MSGSQKRRSFPARYSSTCGVCGLTITQGETIQPLEEPGYAGKTYGHEKCLAARAFVPELKEAVPCPECSEEVTWGGMSDHLLRGQCDGYRVGALPWQVRAAKRQVLYSRMDAAESGEMATSEGPDRHFDEFLGELAGGNRWTA